MRGVVRVDLGSGGASVAIVLATADGNRTRRRQSRADEVIHGSGSDVVLNSTALTQMPFNNSFSEMEIQMPGAVRGANGVVHINGDHGVINYMIDGVALAAGTQPRHRRRDQPQRSLVRRPHRGCVSRRNTACVSARCSTWRREPGPGRRDSTATRRSARIHDAQIDSSAITRRSPGGGGYRYRDFNGYQTTRGLDPPNFDSPHNNASSVGPVRALHVARGREQLHERHVHQQQQHVSDSQRRRQRRAGVDRRQRDASRHVSCGAVSPCDRRHGRHLRSARRTRRRRSRTSAIRRTTSIYGEALNVERSAVRKRRHVDRLRQRPHRPERRLSSDDVRLFAGRQADGARLHHAGRLHPELSVSTPIAAGVSYDLTRVLKYYAITLQPNNFLAPILTPDTPDAPTTVVDNAPNLGNTYQSYVQDSWRMSGLWEADYGLRYDFFTIKSTEFSQGFGAFSPRLKLTRFFGQTREPLRLHRAILRAVFARKRQPAGRLSAQSSAAADRRAVRPQAGARYAARVRRPHSARVGRPRLSRLAEECKRPHRRHASRRHAAPSGHQLRARAVVAGGTQLRSAAAAQRPVRTSPSRTSSRSTAGCETQLLAPCFGAPTGFTPADHEQSWSMASGVLLNDRRGGWFSADGEYGSGLSSAICPRRTRPATASKRPTRCSTSKKASRSRRRPR